MFIIFFFSRYVRTIGKDVEGGRVLTFFEVLQLLVCEVHIYLCRFHLDILRDIGEDALLGGALLQYL
jgi:hypothetical protein